MDLLTLVGRRVYILKIQDDVYPACYAQLAHRVGFVGFNTNYKLRITNYEWSSCHAANLLRWRTLQYRCGS